MEQNHRENDIPISTNYSFDGGLHAIETFEDGRTYKRILTDFENVIYSGIISLLKSTDPRLRGLPQ